MKHNVTLTIASLFSILLMTIHLTQDILRDEGGMASYVVVTVPVLVVWLYGTLLLAGRRSGYVIMLVGSLIAAGMPVIHTMGAGSIKARTHGAFFVWTLLALGVTGVFSLILSVRGLWSPQWGESR
jgi:hypothetical protein